MKIAENKNMKVIGGEYITVADMVSVLEVPTETVKTRLKTLGIKPISRDAIYPVLVLETLKKTPPKGRPKKANKSSNTLVKKSKKKAL
jgi:hypothetical protein